MGSKLRIFAVVACLLSSPVLSFAGGQDCINWPRIMTQIAMEKPSSGKIVVVESFTNYTKQEGDEWLQVGLRNLLASMLKASDKLQILSGLSAIYHPDAKNPEFIVSGMFQHIEGGLRIFVKLSQGTDRKLISQYEIVTPYPESKEFFLRLAGVTKQIWDVIKVGGNQSRLDEIRDATTSMYAFECYEKGTQALETYKISEMEVAKTWFEQSRRADYRSTLGYQGMVNLLTFLGFYHKQRREPFRSYFEQAENELANMNRLTSKAPPPVVKSTKKSSKVKQEKLENLFLLNQAAFIEGSIAADQARWAEAEQAFKKAVGFIPEDAIAWYHLARIYETLGNTAESSKALQKAYEINPCVEK